MPKPKRPFNLAFSIVSGVLFLLALTIDLLSYGDFTIFSYYSVVGVAMTIVVWASMIVLVVGMFVRSGITVGIGMILQAVARLINVFYYGVVYDFNPGYYFSMVMIYPNLLVIAVMILLTVACFRRKMGVPMACVSWGLIFTELTIYFIADALYGYDLLTLSMAIDILEALSLSSCVCALFVGTLARKR